MRQLIAFLLVLLVSVAGAMGKAPSNAEAQEVVVTPTRAYRYSQSESSVMIPNNDYVDISDDGTRLAMIVEVTRPCNFPTEPCYIICDLEGNCHVPDVRERMLRVYNTIPKPYELMCEETLAIGDLYSLKGGKIRQTNGVYSFAVLQGSQLLFLNIEDGSLGYQLQLPERYTDKDELIEYTIEHNDFAVAYGNPNPLTRTPTLTVGGGAYYDSQNTENKGFFVQAVWKDDAFNPLQPGRLGNYVVSQCGILDCYGTVTDIDSEGDGKGNINSALICKREVSDEEDEEVEDTVVLLKSGMRSNDFSLQYTPLESRLKSYNSPTGPVPLSSAIAISGVGQKKTSIAYMCDTVTSAEDVRPRLTLIEEGKVPVKIALFPNEPDGVSVFARDFVARKVSKFKPGIELAAAVVGEKEGPSGPEGLFAVVEINEDGNVGNESEISLGLANPIAIPRTTFKPILKAYYADYQYYLASSPNPAAVCNVNCGATITAGPIVSSPVGVGRDGGMDVVIMEFTITKAGDEDDQGEDGDDQGED